MGGLQRRSLLVGLLAGLAIVAILLTLLDPASILAQEPTPAVNATTTAESSSFFDFGIGEVIDLVTAGAVIVLGFWLFRIQGARMDLLKRATQDARDQLDDQRHISAQEVELERRHTEQLREQNAAAIEAMEKQLELAKQQAGIDESGQVSAAGTALPIEVQEQMREMLSLIKNMKASQDALAPGEQPPELTADDFVSSGNAYFAAGDYERALTDYDQALVVRPDHPEAIMNRGSALYRLGRPDRALEAFDKALTLRPDHPAMLMNRGSALTGLGRHEEALQAYDQALAVRADHPETIMGRGNVLGRLGRREEALQAYDQALALRANHPSTLYNRACMFSLWEKPAEALEDLRRAIEGNSMYRQKAREDTDFDNIRDDPRFKELVGEPEDESAESEDNTDD